MKTRRSLRNLSLPVALLFLTSAASLTAQTGSSGALIGTVRTLETGNRDALSQMRKPRC